MRAILDGIVVADFSRVLAGPLATAALGDLGATVIKVESPAGDDTRAWGPPFVDGESSYFMSVNRNKRSIALDLKDPADRALARTLAVKTDVLVENFRPGVAERLGLGYDELSALNPRLVYGSITGFGPNGPGRDKPGYDFVVQALSGLMSITGEAQGQPMKVGVAIVDVLAGLNLQAGMLAALYDREHSGQGQRVDVTLMGSALAGLVNQASSWLTAGVEPRREANVHPSIAPYESLQAADGVIVLAVGNDVQFARCVAALGCPELGHDPRFARNSQRVAHRRELRAAMEAALMTRPVTDWVATLTAAGVPCARVNTIPEAFEFSDQAGMPATIGIAGPDGTTVAQVASPVTYSSTPVCYRLPPPRLAEHDREIRQWLHGEQQLPFRAETPEGRVTA